MSVYGQSQKIGFKLIKLATGIMGKKHSRCNYNTKIFCLKKRCHEITCFCKAALVLLVCCLNTLISFSMSGNAMNLLRKREKLFNNLLKGFTKSR